MKANYPLWSAQVLSVIRAAQLNDLLTGEDLPPEKEISSIVDNKPVKSGNPAYSAWVAQPGTKLSSGIFYPHSP
jgi:hypothetical protein